MAQKGTADGIPLNVSEGDGFDLRSGGSGHGGVVRLTPIDSPIPRDSATPLRTPSQLAQGAVSIKNKTTIAEYKE